MWQAGLGTLRTGNERNGEAVWVGNGGIRTSDDRFGWRGIDRSGAVMIGAANQGMAGRVWTE